MRIGIDISQIIYGTGVSYYTRELLVNLYKIDKEDQFITFGGTLRRKEELKQWTSNVLSLSPTLADLLWNRLHVIDPQKLVGNFDILHSSDWTQPPTKALKVTTVHDLVAIKFPNETPRKIIDVHKRRLYWVLKEVDRIIVPTNQTKIDLMEIGANAEKIKVIYEGVGENFIRRSEKEIESVKIKYQIHEDYILTVGVGKRKNSTRLIEAFEKTKNKHKLVIVGGGKKMDIDNRGIIHTGYLSEDDLICLYSGAKALVYPSLYEGFGLPILQAMACGVPVVTSDIGAMKEIAGTSAILVDPLDINSIRDGIEKAVVNQKTLSKKGYKRVKDFSWEKCAKETLEVYRGIISHDYRH
ncbi:MAG TPA: glycosyltransferase family 1 protein [Patescibacteria group bacterium]|nr:glycosyltransferase family 1 protein [Patescibacteria group bacterium]